MYNDADIEQNELERLGNASAAAKARGECPHEWRQGGIKPWDVVTCLECNKRATNDDLDFERNEALGN